MLEKLWKGLVDDGYYSKSFEEFKIQELVIMSVMLM